MNNKYDNHIIDILKGLILKYGSKEDKEGILNEDEENKDPIKIQTISLKPDGLTFKCEPEKIQQNRLESIPEEDLDNKIFFYDLFELIQNNCLQQFGLPHLTLNDMFTNNITQAIIVVNKKGVILKIIANKEANTLFLAKIINNSLEYKLKKLPFSSKILNRFNPNKSMKKPSPFDNLK